jgi:hypothetical protein
MHSSSVAYVSYHYSVFIQSTFVVYFNHSFDRPVSHYSIYLLSSGLLRIVLMMEAASTSETSVNFYQTTRRNNPEDSHLHTYPQSCYRTKCVPEFERTLRRSGRRTLLRSCLSRCLVRYAKSKPGHPSVNEASFGK